jgi:hypothetical protein
MTKPGRTQDRRTGAGRPRVSDPGARRSPAGDHDKAADRPVADHHGIPSELEKAKNSSEDTEPKGHPTSDRENMETAVLKQKPRQS